jgi:hypothetical protein
MSAILRIGNLQLQFYLYVFTLLLLLLASRWGLAWTFGLNRSISCRLARHNQARHVRDFDNSDSTIRSCAIIPGIDLGYGPSPQSAWTFFKTPAPFGGTLVSQLHEIPYRPSLYQRCQRAVARGCYRAVQRDEGACSIRYGDTG